MSTDLLLNPEMNNIVFEGRNKAYGAYQLRLHYERNMSKGMLLGIAFFLACMTSFIYIQKLEWNEQSADKIFTFSPIIELQTAPPPEIPIPKTIQRIPPPTLKSQIQFVEPKVVAENDQTIENPPPTQIELSNNITGVTKSENESGETDPGLIEGPPDSGINSNPIIGEQHSPLPYVTVEQKPEFPGGMKGLSKYLQENLKSSSGTIPDNARVRFVIDKEGFVRDVNILSSSSKNFERAVMKVVENMPQWKPGKHNGQAVTVAFILPIKIQLR